LHDKLLHDNKLNVVRCRITEFSLAVLHKQLDGLNANILYGNKELLYNSISCLLKNNGMKKYEAACAPIDRFCEDKHIFSFSAVDSNALIGIDSSKIRLTIKDTALNIRQLTDEEIENEVFEPWMQKDKECKAAYYKSAFRVFEFCGKWGIETDGDIVGSGVIIKD
jgi:hypothetical protein